MRRTLGSVLLLALGLLGLVGCSAPQELPPIECSDGYMAPATEGCSAAHGGARNEFKESIYALLDALPDAEPTAYLCGDGWLSTSVGDPGACSWHNGVYGLVYPDGTQWITEGGRLRLIHPDGEVEYIPTITP